VYFRNAKSSVVSVEWFCVIWEQVLFLSPFICGPKTRRPRAARPPVRVRQTAQLTSDWLSIPSRDREAGARCRDAVVAAASLAEGRPRSRTAESGAGRAAQRAPGTCRAGRTGNRTPGDRYRHYLMRESMDFGPGSKPSRTEGRISEELARASRSVAPVRVMRESCLQGQVATPYRLRCLCVLLGPMRMGVRDPSPS